MYTTHIGWGQSGGRPRANLRPWIALGLFALALTAAALTSKPTAPAVTQMASPDLSTYCYAYGGLYNVEVFYSAADQKCLQDFNGQMLPVAYKEIINK